MANRLSNNPRGIEKREIFEDLFKEIIEYSKLEKPSIHPAPVVLNCKNMEMDFMSRFGEYCIDNWIEISYKYPHFYINNTSFIYYINNLSRPKEHLINVIFAHLKEENIPVFYCEFDYQKTHYVEIRWIHQIEYEDKPKNYYYKRNDGK